MIWFRHTQGLNSRTMREIAEKSGVSWDYQAIIYRGRGVGYINGDESDKTTLQDAAESVIGYRPAVIDAPPERDTD